MSFIREMFSESGDISAMRVMAMIALIAAIGLAFSGKDTTLVGAFLAFSGGGHVAGKYVETMRGDPK